LYISVQNNKEFRNSNVLDPICPIFLNDIENTDTFCSSISSLQSTYTSNLENIKQAQIGDILHILERLYEIENFNKTKEVLFLLDKSEKKLRVLDILNEFDNIKNEFDNLDKEKIQCNSLRID
jgi:hypothetical protein